MLRKPETQMDARDYLERWREVARTSAAELKAASPAIAAAWAEAQARAEAVVRILEEAVEAERAANAAWRRARAAERKPGPRLTVVE